MKTPVYIFFLMTVLKGKKNVIVAKEGVPLKGFNAVYSPFSQCSVSSSALRSSLESADTDSPCRISLR